MHKGSTRTGSTRSVVIKVAGDGTSHAWACPMSHLPEEGVVALPTSTFLAVTDG